MYAYILYIFNTKLKYAGGGGGGHKQNYRLKNNLDSKITKDKYTCVSACIFVYIKVYYV